MLKIRLMRIGAKKKPFYRVVVVDERSKRTSAYIELLGTYDPLTEPKTIKLKQDRIDHWIKQGAQLSTGYLRIIGKAPQRLPRKPKKEKTPKEVAPKTQEEPTKSDTPDQPATPEASATTDTEAGDSNNQHIEDAVKPESQTDDSAQAPTDATNTLDSAEAPDASNPTQTDEKTDEDNKEPGDQ